MHFESGKESVGGGSESGEGWLGWDVNCFLVFVVEDEEDTMRSKLGVVWTFYRIRIHYQEDSVSVIIIFLLGHAGSICFACYHHTVWSHRMNTSETHILLTLEFA